MDDVTPVPELRAYMKSLPSDEARNQFAADCGTSVGHMNNVSYGSRPLAPESCVLAERGSGGVLRRWHLRPRDWHRIWPELIGSDGAPDAPANISAPLDQDKPLTKLVEQGAA
jgi:DNA-binding transcriptional regulator YdaS (Cro superfamily)